MDTIRKADSRRGRIAYEVAGLAWLADASDPGTAVVPVLDHGATWLEEPRLVSVAPTPRAAEEFGRALAHTHAAGATHLGAAPPGHAGDGWMGEAHLSLPDRPTLAPASSSEESWGAFYARERIAPYSDDRTFTSAERALIDKLCDRLESGALDHGQPRLVEDAKERRNNVGAARTHGDLWSGNVMWTPTVPSSSTPLPKVGTPRRTSRPLPSSPARTTSGSSPPTTRPRPWQTAGANASPCTRCTSSWSTARFLGAPTHPRP